MLKKRILIIELIVWLLIIFCASFFHFYNTNIKDNVKNTYYIFFDDVEGLIKGSPVRLMGVNIGYIKNIKIFDNKVFVSMLVTKKDAVIPKCATATIEFYGLGGSTSLELNPATASETDNREEIIPAGTYRVQDYWDGAKLSSEVMIALYTSARNAIDDSGILHRKQSLKQSKNIEKLINQTNMASKSETILINKMTKETYELLKKKGAGYE